MGIITSKRVAIKKKNVFTEIPAGQYSQPIQIKDTDIKQNALHFGVDDYGNLLTGKNFSDISTINNVNGQPTGLPANNGVNILMYDFQKTDWYNVGAYNIIFQLPTDYNLDYCYIYNATGSINIEGSEDGVLWRQLAPTFEVLNIVGWTKVNFLGDVRTGNRFFRLGLRYQDMYVRGFVLYGRPIGTNINKGIKYQRRVINRTVDKHMGTNGFYLEHADMMARVSGTHRLYVVPQWIYGSKWWNPGQGQGKVPGDVEMRFTKSDPNEVVNIDQVLQGYKNAGSKVMIDINNSPSFLRPVGTKDPGASKPVDPGYSTIKLADTTDPFKYTFIARIAWQIAARYGANKNVDQQFIKLVPGEPIRVGLNLVEVLEVGNEMDKWWYGAQAYTNPQEMAAYMSAIYDGHMGQLGPGFGIKAADPSMKVSLVSLASGDNDPYVNEIIWWMDKYRGKGNYAFDLINYHWYNSSEGSQDAADGAYGVQPEKGSLIEANKRWSNFRDVYCPSVEVWLTEIGYDEHLGGVFSPKYATQFERSRYKAYWLTRTYMINQMCGVDVTNQYWFSNHGGTRLEDNDPYEPRPDKFRSSGLTDGIRDANDWNRKPLMSFWYVSNIKNTLTGFKYSHTIMKQGVSNTAETIINNTNVNIWSMAYKDYINNVSYIAIWLDSAEFKTLSVTLNVPESSVAVIDIDEAEIRLTDIGKTTIYNTSTGKLTLNISECPKFIRTTNIGTPNLLPVENIETQKLTKGGTLVTWVDRNIGQFKVIIKRSENQSSGYGIIFQGEVPEASWVDANTETNKTYYYKVDVVRDFSTVPTDDLWKTSFDSAFFAEESLTQTGSKPLNNEQVVTIKDQIGTLDMNYSGLAVPMLSRARPKFYTSLQGQLFFPNETGVNYKSSVFPMVFPQEIWDIGYLYNYQIYEAIHNSGDTPYFGDLGGNGLRTRNGSEFEGDTSWFTDMKFTHNTPFLVRRVYYDERPNIPQANGADLSHLVTCDVWINGIKVPKRMSALKVRPQHNISVGADTNNAHWGMKALLWKGGVNSDSTANELTDYFMNKYLVNQDYNLPYAQNLEIVKSGKQYSVNYTMKTIGAIGEDTSKTIIRWINTYEGITYAVYIPELNGRRTFNSDELLDKPLVYDTDINSPTYGQRLSGYDLTRGVRVEVTCYDMQNRSLLVPQTIYIGS